VERRTDEWRDRQEEALRNFATRLKIICAQKSTSSSLPMENVFECFRKYQGNRTIDLFLLSAVPKNLNLRP
jgi:hypothetical protein